MKVPALLLMLLFAVPVSAGDIFHYAEMNTREIAALDVAKTVVILPGGIVEQHGPCLPSATDLLLAR